MSLNINIIYFAQLYKTMLDRILAVDRTNAVTQSAVKWTSGWKVLRLRFDCSKAKSMFVKVGLDTHSC